MSRDCCTCKSDNKDEDDDCGAPRATVQYVIVDGVLYEQTTANSVVKSRGDRRLWQYNVLGSK